MLDDRVEKLVDNSRKRGFGPALPHFRHRKRLSSFCICNSRCSLDVSGTRSYSERNTRPKAELPYSCGVEGIDGTYVRSPGGNHLGDEECRFTHGTLKSY
jgi:hypothetical protein